MSEKAFQAGVVEAVNYSPGEAFLSGTHWPECHAGQKQDEPLSEEHSK
jgi:hypothetical protein